MRQWNTSDPKFLRRAHELNTIMQETDIKLKRHFKFSKRQISRFWGAVWEKLEKHPDGNTETFVEEILNEIKEGSRKF